MKPNRYRLLRLKIVLLLLRRGFLGPRKLWNLGRCYVAHFFRTGRSGALPFIVSVDLSNECNANCVFCRTPRGEIYNYNPRGDRFLSKGTMPFELYTGLIDEVKDHIVMAILYVSGEPLVYPRIYDAIAYASARHVATMISTNGILLTDASIRKLIASGVCFVKVAVSGFSDTTFRRQSRAGDVEKIKENLALFQRLNRQQGGNVILMLDFMSYDFNAHEVDAARSFCDEHGIMFNVRPGLTRHMGLADAPPPQTAAGKDVGVCDWPWKTLTVNWNGDVFPCCDYVVWSGMPAYKRITVGDIGIRALWNGPQARANRAVHARRGRAAIDVCRECTRCGITFKY